MFAQVLLGVLVGLAGVLFASPLVAVLRVIIEKLYVQDRLEAKAQPSGSQALNSTGGSLIAPTGW